MKIFLTVMVFAAALMSTMVRAETEGLDVALDLYFGTDMQQNVEQSKEHDFRTEISAST